jgi:hypothetical protein
MIRILCLMVLLTTAVWEVRALSEWMRAYHDRSSAMAQAAPLP